MYLEEWFNAFKVLEDWEWKGNILRKGSRLHLCDYGDSFYHIDENDWEQTADAYTLPKELYLSGSINFGLKVHLYRATKGV